MHPRLIQRLLIASEPKAILTRRKGIGESGSRSRRLMLEQLDDRRLLAGNVWLQRGSDAGHTSYLEISVDPVSFAQAWNRPLTYANSGTGSWSEEAVASDGVRVYRTALEGYAPVGTYHVIAYDLATGSEVWHRTFTGNAFEGVSEPSISGGTVFVNRAGHSGNVGGTTADYPTLYGFSAATGQTMLTRTYEAQWGSNERPAIEGNQLIVEDGYYGGMSSYSTTSLTRQWTRPGHQLEKPFAAIDDQYIYAYGEEVYTRAGVPQPSFTHPWPSSQLSDPMVSASGFTASGRVLLDVASGSGPAMYGIAAYHGDTHQLLWTAQTPTFVGAKAVGNGIVAATAGQSLMLFSESTGSFLRSWQAPSSLMGEIVLTQSHVFVQSISSGVARVHAIDVTTGQEVWTFENRNSPTGTYAMEMAMAGGKLLLSNHDFVRAFSLGTPNNAPIATGAALSTTEEIAVSGTLTASDPNSDAFTYSIVSGPFGGSLQNFNPITGTFTYRPHPNDNGPDSFTFRAVDSRGAVSNVATVSISVTPVNDPPTAQQSSISTSEDTPREDFVFAYDVEDDDLTFALVSLPTNGTIVVFNHNNGLFRYVPNANFNGSDSFRFKANDGIADSSPATVFINVFAVNDAPVASNVTVVTLQNAAVNGQLAATDVESTALTYVTLSNPASGTLSNFNPNTGTFTYTPNAGFSGTDTFTYRATDGQLTSNTATVTLRVNYINQPPVAIDQTLTTVEDTNLNALLRATDDLGPATFAIVAPPLRGTVTITNASTGAFSYVPTPNIYGPDSFTFSVSDGEYTDEGRVDINVTPVNDPPVAAAIWPYSTNEDTPVSDRLLASDVDNDPLTYRIITPPPSGNVQLNAATGEFTYTPAANTNGPIEFTFEVTDGALVSGIGRARINIAPVNDAPTAFGWQFGTDEDTSLTDSLRTSDVDGDPLTYSIVAQPAMGTVQVNSSTGEFTYTPAANVNGTFSFAFKVNDGRVDSNVAPVFVTVRPVNDAPLAHGASFTVTEDQVLSGTLSGSDVEGSPLTFSVVTPPASGSLQLTPSSGAFTYTPAASFNGPLSFTFQVNDGTVSSASAAITIQVLPANDAPVALPQSAATNEDTALAGMLLATDIDQDSLTYAISRQPTHGTVTLNATTGAYVYVPHLNYNGPDHFEFTASDGSLTSNAATVSIQVQPVNDAPAAIDAVFSLPENSGVGTAVGVVQASDVEGDVLSYALSGVDAASFAINGSTGAISVANAALLDFETRPQFTFNVLVNDGRGGVATAAVQVRLTDQLVEIDILPDDDSNTVNLSTKDIEVAVLASATFNPLTMLDLSTVRLRAVGSSASAGVPFHARRGYQYEQRDVNGDGRLDLILKFKTADTGLTLSTTKLRLEGALTPAQGAIPFVIEQAVTVKNGGGGGGGGNGGNGRH